MILTPVTSLTGGGGRKIQELETNAKINAALDVLDREDAELGLKEPRKFIGIRRLYKELCLRGLDCAESTFILRLLEDDPEITYLGPPRSRYFNEDIRDRAAARLPKGHLEKKRAEKSAATHRALAEPSAKEFRGWVRAAMKTEKFAEMLPPGTRTSLSEFSRIISEIDPRLRPETLTHKLIRTEPGKDGKRNKYFDAKLFRIIKNYLPEGFDKMSDVERMAAGRRLHDEKTKAKRREKVRAAIASDKWPLKPGETVGENTAINMVCAIDPTIKGGTVRRSLNKSDAARLDEEMEKIFEPWITKGARTITVRYDIAPTPAPTPQMQRTPVPMSAAPTSGVPTFALKVALDLSI
jgi:hypothetical protein